MGTFMSFVITDRSLDCSDIIDKNLKNFNACEDYNAHNNIWRVEKDDPFIINS